MFGSVNCDHLIILLPYHLSIYGSVNSVAQVSHASYHFWYRLMYRTHPFGEKGNGKSEGKGKGTGKGKEKGKGRHADTGLNERGGGWMEPRLALLDAIVVQMFEETIVQLQRLRGMYSEVIEEIQDHYEHVPEIEYS